VERVRGELLERQAARSAHIVGLCGEVKHGTGIEGEDGESGIFGADFIDIVEPLKIPGVNVNEYSVPGTAGEDKKEFVERLGAMNLQGDARSVSQRLRDFRPGEIFAQEKNLKI